MGIFDFLKKQRKDETQKQNTPLTEEAITPIEITHSYQSTHPSPNEKSTSYQRINIVSDTETGKVVDEYLDKMDEAFNDPRLAEYSKDATAKYNAMALKTKKDEAFIKVLELAKNKPTFIQNCSDYPRPYTYIIAIADELDRIYSKTKDERFNPLSDSYEMILYNYCVKTLEIRNIDIFSMLVKPLTNHRQKSGLHYGNFLNKYARFIGKEYQLGDDPTVTGKKYFEVYKQYQKYEYKLSKIKSACREMRIRTPELFNEHGLSYADSFEEYYNNEDKGILMDSLDTIISEIGRLSRENTTKKVCEALIENPNFIRNSEIYGGSIEYVTHVTEQLSSIYEATQNSRFNPNSINCLKVYCTLPEEERNALFEKALSETENKGIKK